MMIFDAVRCSLFIFDGLMLSCQEEIFGPVLPILTVGDMDEAIAFVNSRDKALALYVFTGDTATANHVVTNTFAGGRCFHALSYIIVCCQYKQNRLD